MPPLPVRRPGTSGAMRNLGVRAAADPVWGPIVSRVAPLPPPVTRVPPRQRPVHRVSGRFTASAAGPPRRALLQVGGDARLAVRAEVGVGADVEPQRLPHREFQT